MYNIQKLTCRLTLLYRVYTQFMTSETRLLGVAVNDEKEKETDALRICLERDSNFAARISQLYVSVMDARPLPVQIVRQLSSERDFSVKELKGSKRSKIRLAFYIDSDFSIQDYDKADKAIVLLLYFPKKDNKATAMAIEKAKAIRDRFLKLKELGKLDVEVT